MDTKDYHLWKQIQAQLKLELEKKGDFKEAEKVDTEEELEDEVFEAVSKRAWTDILLQIYKVRFIVVMYMKFAHALNSLIGEVFEACLRDPGLI